MLLPLSKKKKSLEIISLYVAHLISHHNLLITIILNFKMEICIKGRAMVVIH